MTNLIQGNKPKNLRSHNIKAILSLLMQEKELTIRDISNRIQLSVTTTSKIVNHLVSSGVLTSAGKGASSAEGGKCPELFSLNASYCYLIVCSLSFPTSRLVLLDLTTRIIDEVELYGDSIVNHPYENVLADVAQKVDQILAAHNLVPEQIYRVVISAGGITNPMDGIIHDAFVPSWPKNVSICKDLSQKLPNRIPVYLDHANVFIGYAENLNFSKSNKSYWVLLKDQGVCVYNIMEPVRGSLGYTGSFNLMIIDAGRSNIYKKSPGGNFSTLVSEEALHQLAVEFSGSYPESSLTAGIRNSTLKPTDIFSAADGGDALARKIVDTVVYWFYVECHNLIVLYNPQKILIQGLYRQAGQYFLSKLTELGKYYPSYEDNPSYEIAFSSLDETKADAAGAALYVFQHFLIDSF